MSADDAMTAGPCRHLDAAQVRCVNGGVFPRDCGGCASYEDSELLEPEQLCDEAHD